MQLVSNFEISDPVQGASKNRRATGGGRGADAARVDTPF